MNSTPAASTNILSHSLWMAFFNPIYLRCNVCETKNHLNIIIEFFRHKIIRGSYNMTKKANWLSQTNVCVNIILYLSKGYTKIMFNRYRPDVSALVMEFVHEKENSKHEMLLVKPL